MTSPLLPYANAYLLIEERGVPTNVNGRIVASVSSKKLVQCYLKRQDSAGTSTGADYVPTRTGNGDVLPGVSGDVYLYRGYALRYATVSNTYDLMDVVPSSLVWTTFVSTSVPTWFGAGVSGKHRNGNEKTKYMVIERCTGKYGGTSIDQIISENIGGVPLVIYSGDVLN